ncbi:MAG: hypothetical protein ABI824_15880 [Acidobacteriota bacterium]
MTERLKTQRNLLRLSQSRLARLSGVSRYRICLHELGDLSLHSHELALLERALQKELCRLQFAISGAISEIN